MGLIFFNVGLIVQIVLQLLCAIMAYKMWKIINNGNRWWILASAFTLMAFRRLTALLSSTDQMSLVECFDKLFLPLAISILMCIGIAGLKIKIGQVQESNLAKLEELTKKLSGTP